MRMIIFERLRQKRRKMYKWMILVCTCSLLIGCGADPFEADTSTVKLDIAYVNLDSIAVNTPNEQRQAVFATWYQKFPTEIGYNLSYTCGINSITDSSFTQRTQDFYSSDYIVRLEKRIKERFNDLPKRHQSIVEGMKRLKVHFPNQTLPKAIFYTNSYFSASAFCTDDAISVGLERYLGSKTDVIKELPADQFYEWIKKAMDDQYLERDAVCAWAYTHMVKEKEQAYTIENIINWGKILLITEAAYPSMPKHQLLRYSERDYNWALQNERQFWEFLVKEKILFNKDETIQQNLLAEAPFTAGLPQKGPDRLGQFLGWRILHSYMEQYDLTLQELVALPYTELLQEYEIND